MGKRKRRAFGKIRSSCEMRGRFEQIAPEIEKTHRQTYAEDCEIPEKVFEPDDCVQQPIRIDGGHEKNRQKGSKYRTNRSDSKRD